MKKTYCNPLPIEEIPDGRPLDCKLTKADPSLFQDYRSISDPSVIYHDGKWIMYPSYAMAYLSEDLIHWKHIDIGVPELDYSPAIVQFRGKWYLTGHNRPEFFCADEPTGPFIRCGTLSDVHGNPVLAPDGCFLADGDRLYFYWHSFIPHDDSVDVEYLTGTLGVEMNPEKPWEMLSEPVVINTYDPAQTWQHMGEYNQNSRMGWVEGQWAFKIGSRYYLLYSGCGTEFSAYANGIAYSDEGPLSGFHPQKNHNPLTRKTTGLTRGAGHGSIVPGPKGTLWIFYTNTFNFNHMYERRVSMDPLGIDENGELYCPALTDTPQFAPGVLEHPEQGNDAGLFPLTFMQRPTASSNAPGREPIYASDESMLTWWQPAANDPAPEITFRLGSASHYHVHALRLIWRDIGMDCPKGILPGPFRYVVEYIPADETDRWETLIDASGNRQDLAIDYRQFQPVTTRFLRLRILGAPDGITPGLVSLTAFGVCATRN